MQPIRLFTALPFVVILAACDQSPPNPPAATPSASERQATQPAAHATAAPSPAAGRAATAPLFGTWAADLRECGTFPIEISATRFVGMENQCDITELTDNGDGTFTASLECMSQGESASERIRMTPLFAPTGEGVHLNYLDRGETQVTLLRCK